MASANGGLGKTTMLRPGKLSHCLGPRSGKRRRKGKLALLLHRADSHAEIERELTAGWPVEVREHCRLAGVRDGNVVLLVDSSAWATRLRYALPELTETSELLRSAKNIRVKVRPTHESPPEPPLRKPNRLTTQSADVLLACSETIGDDQLAASLRRLAKHASHER